METDRHRDRQTYIYMETDRQKDRHTYGDRQTQTPRGGRETDREREVKIMKRDESTTGTYSAFLTSIRSSHIH